MVWILKKHAKVVRDLDCTLLSSSFLLICLQMDDFFQKVEDHFNVSPAGHNRINLCLFAANLCLSILKLRCNLLTQKYFIEFDRLISLFLADKFDGQREKVNLDIENFFRGNKRI